MGQLLTFVRVAFLIGLYASCFAGGNPEDALMRPSGGSSAVSNRVAGTERSDFTGQADWVYQASGWVLNLYISQKGSRSQGSHGVLLFEGKQVKGSPGEIRALPMGTVEYNGSLESRAHLWDNSGWQMKDPLVKPVIHTPRGQRLPGQSTINTKVLEKDLKSRLSE